MQNQVYRDHVLQTVTPNKSHQSQNYKKLLWNQEHSAAVQILGIQVDWAIKEMPVMKVKLY